MRGKIPEIAMFAVLGIGLTSVFADSCVMPSGKTWHNGKGVKVTLDVTAAGSVTGIYTTAIGCGAGAPRRLTGFCDGHAVAFSTRRPQCESITAWSGSYDHNSIEALWHMVAVKRPGGDSIHSGTDTFVLEYME